MNSMQLKDKLKELSNRKSINFNILLRNYTYERFIERLACSRYKNNFILKGGYYLSILFGVDSRHTMDIDLSLKNETLSKENVKQIIEEIISIEIADNAIISFDGIDNIREEDKYGGYRIKLTVKIENIRESFNVDIATGDIITPRDIIYKYNTMFNYKSVDLRSYNLETILAEKLETILSKKELSSRLKDYYDIYLIYTLAKDKIDLEILKLAINNTFMKRNFEENVLEVFDILINSEILKIRWTAYAKKNRISDTITYDEVMRSVKSIIEILDEVNV